MIHVENLSYTYKTNNASHKAVDNVSFSVDSGETLGIIGKTGSGKSTLVRMLNGLLKPTNGSVFLDGKNINSDFKDQRDVFFKIGLVFQYPEHQLFQKTVFDDIAFGLRNKSISEEKIKLAVQEATDILGLSKSILNSSPLVLSGGEKRKCAIAGIIALNPDVLILDEPTAGMDFKGRKSLIKCLKEYCTSKKHSVILVSHVMEEVAEISNKVLVMESGKPILYGTSTDVFKELNTFKNIGLKIPQISRIMSIVCNHGYNIKENILTVAEAEKELQKFLKKGETI